MFHHTPTNSDDIIDSRDIIARISELTDERDSLTETVETAQEAYNDAANDYETESEAGDVDEAAKAERHQDEAGDELALARRDLADWEADNADELKALEAFAEECENYAADWRHGETLIRRSYWVDYVQDLVRDIGDIPSYVVIDWDATAENIEADYATVDFDGVEYLIRCS